MVKIRRISDWLKLPPYIIFIIIISIFHTGCIYSQVTRIPRMVGSEKITVGAARTELYFPLLKGMSVGLVCNQTSMVGNIHLVDTLVSAGFHISTIFSPEHGFRGDAEAGAGISDGTDGKTGIKVISLYGDKKKPSPADLEDIDVIVFDIQDVGVRFYTYISTLALVMDAAAEQDIPVIVTDRPNPNGFYVDGPVLDPKFSSFVGMFPIPVVYGMTIGEYATMINGEGWIGSKKCGLTVIPLEGYDHHMIVKLPVKPSPNLPDWYSVYLYPSLCLFEGTIISVGRGTDRPFQVIGHPDYFIGSYIFRPVSIPGISEHPPYEGEACYGMYVTPFAENYKENDHPFYLGWLTGMYKYFKSVGRSDSFFTTYFDKLAGSDSLRKSIRQGLSDDEIRKSWEKDLSAFQNIRKKYLLYPE